MRRKEIDQTILDLLKEHDRLTAEEIRDITGMDRYAITGRLRHLRNSGIIYPVGLSQERTSKACKVWSLA